MSLSPRRTIDQVDCDQSGVPLDWSRCRNCKGTGRVAAENVAGHVICGTCDGAGALHGALLAYFRREAVYEQQNPPTSVKALEAQAATITLRCAGCGHPQTPGVWEGPAVELIDNPDHYVTAEKVEREWVAQQRDPTEIRHNANHWSRCDEQCSHDDVVRSVDQHQEAWFRIVDVRTGVLAPIAHPHPMLFTRPWDLRTENIALLCLPCWITKSAEKTHGTESL